MFFRGVQKIKQAFFYFLKKRPYVILKIASTLDGFIAELDGTSKWITGKKLNNLSTNYVLPVMLFSSEKQ